MVNRFGRWLQLVGPLKADVDNDLSAVTRVTTMHQLGCHDSKQENPWIVSVVCVNSSVWERSLVSLRLIWVESDTL